MANTYTQLYIHGVFAVRSRQTLIFDAHTEEIRKYMCGIVTNLGSKPITANHTGSLPYYNLTQRREGTKKDE